MRDFSIDSWGIVFAGGGGKGSYQVGVLRALVEKGILDYVTGISGSSVGALNAVLCALGDIALAENVWNDITPGKFLTIDPLQIDLKEGILSRDGLIKLLNDYIDLNQVRDNEKTIYATVTETMSSGEDIPRYLRLNYGSDKEIKDILLASTALPILYSPVEINGKVYRDGGISDNLPVRPLYIEGIRHFIVIGLSTESKIDREKYPDAEFVFIKPGKSIGDFWSGTLDFSQKGAVKRMEIGYIDAIREIDFSDKDLNDPNVKILYEAAETNAYKQLEYNELHSSMQGLVDNDMSKINDLFSKYI